LGTENDEKEKAVKEAISRAQQEADSAEENSAETSGNSSPDDDTAEKAEAAEAGKDTAENAKAEEPSAEEMFARRKEKKHRKDKKDEQIEDLTDKLKRSMAEFENFRKRTDKEKSRMYEAGAGDVALKMLPVVDSFERGLAGVSEEQREDPFVAGMEKVYKQLSSTLDEMGVKPIEAVGKEFNPDFHNAVMHVESEEVGENIITEEFQKGYMYHDMVLRHSMVKVAN